MITYFLADSEAANWGFGSIWRLETSARSLA